MPHLHVRPFTYLKLELDPCSFRCHHRCFHCMFDIWKVLNSHHTFIVHQTFPLEELMLQYIIIVLELSKVVLTMPIQITGNFEET